MRELTAHSLLAGVCVWCELQEGQLRSGRAVVAAHPGDERAGLGSACVLSGQADCVHGQPEARHARTLEFHNT
jgi:hypothetical protein